MKKGLIMVLSGNAEDKIVSALGQVFRALGRGVRVCVIEFNGESWLGQSDFSDRFKGLLTVHTLAIYPGPKSENPQPDPKAAHEGWQFVKETINSRVFEMVVLSEFVYLLEHKVVDEHEVVGVLSDRPEDLHVIITGANPPASLVAAADLVTAINRVGRVG